MIPTGASVYAYRSVTVAPHPGMAPPDVIYIDVVPGRDVPFPAQELKIHELGLTSPERVQALGPDSKSSEKNEVCAIRLPENSSAIAKIVDLIMFINKEFQPTNIAQRFGLKNWNRIDIE